MKARSYLEGMNGVRENQGDKGRVTGGEVTEVRSESWEGPDQVEIYKLALDFILNMWRSL